MKKFLYPLLAFLLLGVLHAQDTPIISEFMASNLETLMDDDDDPSDWIELYHPGNSAYDLNGHFLTDDRRNLRKWRIPSKSIDAKGYFLIFASGKNSASLFAANVHTNFELTEDGEYLAFVAPDGETVLSEFASRYPKQRVDISYGISNNADGGTEQRYFTSPSPGAANGAGEETLPPRVADTKFSVTRGFFNEPFQVEITTATEDATIYYSTDGSDPDAGSVFSPGKKVTGPIEITGTTMLRARAFKTGMEPTNIDTHTYLFVADVLEQSDDQPGLPDRWNGQTADYGMDPDVVNDPAYRDLMDDAMLALPTLSVVTERDNLWANDGLYLNTTRGAPAGAGADFQYEFEASAELLHADGRKGFQIQCGLRAQGGASRNADRSPKHAMSLRFRRAYGEGRLNYPVIENSPQQSFNAIHLRARYNNSWIHNNNDQRTRAQLTRDQWARDSMIEMGNPSGGHGNYMHLYLNGLYWGIYNVHERLDNAHYADYHGGRADAIDSINGGRATDGTLSSYNAMRDAARDKDWEEIQERLVVDQYIDWHTIQRFASNRDWKNDGNWKAAGGGTSDSPWRYYSWDTERILEGINEGLPTPSNDPSTIFNSLNDIPEFVVRFGDRLHQHLFNGGALTPERNMARWMKRAEELNTAMIAESARWGDHRRSSNPFTRDNEWQREQDRLINDYFPRRTEVSIEQFRDWGLYPDLDGVTIDPFGGRVDSGYEMKLSSKAFSVFNPGKIYFTTDGSDPREPGGEVAATAQEYASAVPLDESIRIKARARSNRGDWSALSNVYFAVGTAAADNTNVVLTEVMYHPGSPTAEESLIGHVDSDDFEYIEVMAKGDQPVDLTGVTFDAGVRHTFTLGESAIINAGEAGVIVRDVAAFRYRYGDTVRVLGIYDGNLNNNGETIRLLAADGSAISEFEYGDGGSWPPLADGEGFSLVRVSPESDDDPNRGASWRASAEAGGSPAASETVAPLMVYVNEILANSTAPEVDRIELYNDGDADVDISGWFLTDDPNTPMKFVIPPGTILSAKSYITFAEDNDNDPNNNGSLPGEYFGSAFSLSSSGDDAYLFSATAEGELAGYSNGFGFGATADNVSLGRTVDSQGRVEYPAQATPTFGAANSDPLVGPVVISEIMYHTEQTFGDISDAGEFIELVNLSNENLSLTGWEIGGIGFSFPDDASMAAGETILVTKVSADQFRQWYEVPAEIKLFGPYDGRASNDGERLTVRRPGAPIQDGGTERIPLIDVDSVRYNDADPWPAEADGLGRSLERVSLAAYADEVTNWKISEPDLGTPGISDAEVEPGPDGIAYGDWVTTTFDAAQQADEGISGKFADPDADGLANIAEFVLGTAPLTADHEAALTIARTETDGVEVRYARRRNLTGVTITLESSTNLQSWQAAGAEVINTRTEADGADSEVVVSTIQTADPRYLRLSVR